jgi:hypothetical protein
MLKFIHNHAVVIAISLSFFMFGFVLGTGVFDLVTENVLAVFIGGTACGITILLLEMVHSGTQMRPLRLAKLARLVRSE